MNASVSTAMDTNSNPWVESGAMVYVAITVATMSAVIMCCTWFITHNTALQHWWYGKVQYNGVDEEEEIELIEEKEGQYYTDTPKAFTLEDSDSGSDPPEPEPEAVPEPEAEAV